jgi:peroxiredoxin
MLNKGCNLHAAFQEKSSTQKPIAAVPRYLDMQIQAQAVPAVGTTAPDFSLFSHNKKEISLSGLRGRKVVLLFYPQAFTSVCTTELCDVRDNLNRYTNLDADVFGVSVDSPFTLARYHEDMQLTFPLLSDFNKEISSAYGSIYESFAFGMRGVSKRSAFVIDREGIIRHAEVLENAGEIPDLKKIVDVLGEIA